MEGNAMKKVFSLILMLVMCFALSGCGSKKIEETVKETEDIIDYISEGYNLEEAQINGLRFYNVHFDDKGEYNGMKTYIVLNGNIENISDAENIFQFCYSLYYDNGDEYIESDRSNYNYKLLPGETVSFEEVTSSLVESEKPVAFYRIDKIYPYNEDFPIKLQDGTILGVNRFKLKGDVEALIDDKYKSGAYACDILSSTEDLSAIISIQVESNDFEDIGSCKNFARNVIVSMSNNEQYFNVSRFQFQFVSNGILTYSIDVNEVQNIEDISLIENCFEIY